MESALVNDHNTVVNCAMEVHPKLTTRNVEGKDCFETGSRKRYDTENLTADLVLSRGEILALAHEIKNPLTNIALSMAYLNDGNTDPERLVYFEIINRSAERINDLVNGLLATTGHTFEVETCRLNDLVDESLELALDRITLKRVSIGRDFTSESCLVRVDKPRFKIALLNLMVNAVEAMQTGSGHLSVSTVLQTDFCQITIGDNGTGIKNENLSRLFDPYFSSKRSGTGIGLAVAKQIFDSHNCLTEVRSEVGKGTVFFIRLPRVCRG